ncbi:efflux RND transporter periplasmic adaptor subunit [Paenimyroides marinum]|uniref:efflux RND transporter periplasmic adaptor subunit n=1 Tax=Paenimyroides marinum TaxID=1159016 RepID=UPI0021D34DCE|nr:efflux RND transporter periplasmic adaptor subunit [Paenimyroides aquimaris]
MSTTDVVTGEITNEVTATGTVEPVDQVDVGTQVSGLVEKIYVDFNSVVKKGQLLAELDKTNLNESVSNAQAAYNAAQSQLNFQQQNYNRQKNMYEAQVISKADFETAVYQLQNAKAAVTQSQTTLRQAKTNLGYAYIYSPIDGVILTKEVEEGQTVTASMTTPTLFTIAKDITKMQVEADVDEADIGNVVEGQRVSFTVDAFPELEFSGRVKQVRLGATTTSNVVTYTVIVDADNPDQKLKPGLTATITIFTKELKDIIVIPAQALQFTPDLALLTSYYEKNGITDPVPAVNEEGTSVWVLKQNKAIEQKNITIGDKDGVNVQILSGISAGEKVVTAISETKVVSNSQSDSSSDSPFMPKPPSRGNKKATSTN